MSISKRMSRITPDWKHHRVIHSKYPPLDCFDSEDSLLLSELESATNDRLVNWSRFVSKQDLRTGPGWGAVMASFCYPSIGRFNTLTRGAYYAADSVETALREWTHHTAKVWQGFGLGNEVTALTRCYTGQFAQPLMDLRNQPKYAHADNYRPGQVIAEELYQDGEFGVLYDSVRHPGHQAVALLRPPATTSVAQAGHYALTWSGQRFTGYARVEGFQPL